MIHTCAYKTSSSLVKGWKYIYIYIYIKDMDFTAFDADLKTQAAVIRVFEIILESAVGKRMRGASGVK